MDVPRIGGLESCSGVLEKKASGCRRRRWWIRTTPTREAGAELRSKRGEAEMRKIYDCKWSSFSFLFNFFFLFFSFSSVKFLFNI